MSAPTKTLVWPTVVPTPLRCPCVVFHLLKQLSLELPAESEVFLVFLIKVIGDESETVAGGETHLKECL
jgi:hypothetical protein